MARVTFHLLLTVCVFPLFSTISNKVMYNRLAHMTHMDSCLRDFSSGFPTFYYILIRFVLRKPSTLSEISRSSVARPWLSDLTVQGSNPINAKSFFINLPFQIKRLRYSVDWYCEIALGNQRKRLKLQNQVN